MKKVIAYRTVAGSGISGNTQEIFEVFPEFSIRTYILWFTGIFFITGLFVMIVLW